MKFFFYLWCLLNATTLQTARGIWMVYKDRQHSQWFKHYFGKTLFDVEARTLLLVSPIFDFLSDVGVVFTLERMTHLHGIEASRSKLAEFTNTFTLDIALPYLNGAGLRAYVAADDFATVRMLYLRNLLPLLTHTSDSDDEKDRLWTELLSHQLKPELAL